MLFWVNYLCMYNTVDSSVINSDIPPYFLIFVPCIVLLQLLPYLCRHRRFMAASFSKAIITVSWLQIRLPVTGGVSCPDATGLRKFHPCRHSAVSAETTTVGDERCSPAGILFVAVRAHHPAASPIALAESSGAHRLQACSPCVQVPYLADELSQPARASLRSTTSSSLFVRRTRLSTICLLYTSPSPRDRTRSRMPSSA